MIWMVIWTVFMILCVAGGGGIYCSGPSPNYRYFGAFFLLWVCVLILGLILFGAVSLNPTPTVNVR